MNGHLTCSDTVIHCSQTHFLPSQQFPSSHLPHISLGLLVDLSIVHTGTDFTEASAMTVWPNQPQSLPKPGLPSK
jgi:hypothetical protein